MRIIYCWFLLLTACASHEVRCDRHLQRINLTVAGAAGPAVTPRRTP